MTPTTFWEQVRQVNGHLRLYRRLQEEQHPTMVRMRRVGAVFIWAVLPGIVPALPYGVGLYLAAIYTMSVCAQQGSFQINVFEALRMPSRRALFMARLLPTATWLLWMGLCAGFTAWLHTIGPLRGLKDEWVLPTFVALLPLAVFAVWGGVVVALGLCRPQVRQALQGAAFMIVIMAALFFPMLLQADLAPPALWLALLVVLTFALFVWQTIGVAWIDALPGVQSATTPPPAVMQPTARGAHVTVTVGTTPSAARTGLRPEAIGPSRLVGDRKGLVWAAVVRLLASLRQNWFAAVIPSLIAAMLLLSIAVSPGEPNLARLGGMYWLPFLTLFTPSPLRLPHPYRLYLLGVPYRTLVLHGLRTAWASPVLLLCVLVLVPVGLVGGVHEGPLALAALLVALTLFRVGWWEWPSAEVGPGWTRAFWLTVLLCMLTWVLAAPTTFWLPDWPLTLARRIFLFAGVVAALGVGAIVYKLRWATEERVRAAYVVQ
jgi:hypothetical protein